MKKKPDLRIHSVELLIRKSKAELNLAGTKKKLQQAQQILHQITKNNHTAKCDSLQAKIYVENALNSGTPYFRRENWKKGTQLLRESFNRSKSPKIAIDYGNIVIDSSQDIYSNIHDKINVSNIANAKRNIKICLTKKEELTFSEYSTLLSRLSALLRQQSFFIDSFVHKNIVLKKALRTSQKAVEVDKNNSWTLLELGNCYWALARYSDSDIEYNQNLLKAESLFKNASTQSNEIAALALSKFYRLTYQPSKACETFLTISIFALDKRRVLREAFILAEAAQNLWYSQYPEEYLTPLMNDAKRFLELAIEAGYNHARIIIDLAILHAMQGDIENSQNIISSELLLNDKQFDWNNVVNIILSGRSENSLAGKGFALGITSANSLNKIGTFAKDFLSDQSMASAFYNAALKLSPNNPAVLNNIASNLIEQKDPSTYPDIHRLLDKARIFSDRRFTWWQINLNKLSELKGVTKKPKYKRILKSKGAIHSFHDRRIEYYKLADLKDHNERGRKFEKYINDLISISFTETLGPHSAPGIQNDGFFIHRSTPFRVEVKWFTPAIEARIMRQFVAGIEIGGLHGVFVSMSGYSKGALKVAERAMVRKCILLIDKQDILNVIEGELSFNNLIDLKFINFYTKECVI